MLADGRSIALPTRHLPPPESTLKHTPLRHWLLLALIAAAATLAYWRQWGRWQAATGQWIQGHVIWVTGGITATFLVLVAFGVTGSSVQLLHTSPWNLSGQGILQFEGQSEHLFKPRGVRSDEWLVLGPNTLAQWNHVPPFPIINTNLGPEGQNMGVIGMTGVPIAQLASIGRVATWGYFFLPLSQALSWHWQLPFFACLLSLWWALNLLRPQATGFNLAAAATFCLAPYAAGWSLWPLYASFFPLALFVFGAMLFKSEKVWRATWLGLAMGVLLTGWVLVLYPPWQITVGTALGVLTIGWCLDHKKILRCGLPQFWGLLLALTIAVALLFSWWQDTASAVGAIQNTVYPGARAALQGADIDLPWWTLRGYLNPDVLTFSTPHLNQSEISAYLLLPLPLLLLGTYYSTIATSYRWTLRCCMLFIVFWLVFRFWGIPLWLAKITLWSHVTATRLDLCLALVCTAILVLINDASATTSSTHKQQIIHGWTASLLVAIASGALVIWQFAALPAGLPLTQQWTLQASIALAIGIAAWWIMRGNRTASASAMLLLLSTVSTLAFNPLSLAPQQVHLNHTLLNEVIHPTTQDKSARTLVLSDSTTPSMLLAAGGAPTLGGVLYYPQPSMWQSMGLVPSDWPTVNRYQHLTFELARQNTEQAFSVRNSQADTVIVSLDPQRFDFSKAGASLVAAKQVDADQLHSNTSLSFMGQHTGFTWFKVLDSKAASIAPL